MVRVRFAPSPTGFLHVGGLRTALYNELFALRNGGVFLLRIEDTDRTRYVEGAVESLLRTLQRCGIEPQEGPYLAEDGSVQERGDKGPYVQSARTAIYQEHVDLLLADGNAYRCFCSSERLEETRKAQAEARMQVMYDRTCRDLPAAEVETKVAAGTPFVVRMRMPVEGHTTFTDAVRGEISFENALIDDQVLLKTDGFPTYHLANVVDDHLMGITHVIRAEEWLPSTPKHVGLYAAFGWTPPQFAHVPLLLNPDKSKLSKRQGDVAAEDYLDKGYLPEALVNFVALCGWNPSGDREIYTKKEMADAFDLGKVNSAGAVFAKEKLDWMNAQYLRALTEGELFQRALPFLEKAGTLRHAGDGFLAADGTPVAWEKARRAVASERERIHTLAELPEAIGYMLAGEVAVDAALLPGKKATPEVAKARLEGMIAWVSARAEEAFDDRAALEAAGIAHIKEQGWTNAETLWPTRVALSGRAASPGPFELMRVLGKDATIARLASAAAKL
jgi:nondiscriminating glutamyl-tRNA synthetase